MALVTPAQARAFVRGLQEESDANVELFIRNAEAILVAWLRWPAPDGSDEPTLETASYIDFHDRPATADGRTLYLACPVVTAVTGVTTDVTGNHAPGVAVTGFQLGAKGKVVVDYEGGAWPTAFRGTRVAYTGGFSPSAVPAAVESALLLLVRELWTKRVVLDVPEEPRSALPAILTADVKALVMRYRKAVHLA